MEIISKFNWDSTIAHWIIIAATTALCLLFCIWILIMVVKNSRTVKNSFSLEKIETERADIILNIRSSNSIEDLLNVYNRVNAFGKDFGFDSKMLMEYNSKFEELHQSALGYNDHMR